MDGTLNSRHVGETLDMKLSVMSIIKISINAASIIMFCRMNFVIGDSDNLFMVRKTESSNSRIMCI